LKILLGALEVNDYETAADEMIDSRWFTQVGLRGLELSEQLRTGQWQD